MSLRDDAHLSEARAETPPKFRQGAEIDGDEGTGSTGLIAAGLVKSNDDLLRFAGYDPAEWMITGKVQQWTKTLPSGKFVSLHFNTVRKTPERARVAQWLASKIEPVASSWFPVKPGDPLVVVFSDLQLGKGEGDGTDGTIRRFESCLARVAEEVECNRPDHLVIVDAGDSVENMFSHTSGLQIATLDRTLDEQLQIAQRLFTEAIITLAPHAGLTTMTGVASNHGEVRNGQGHVGDGDFGLSNLRAIASAFDLLGTNLNLEFVIPDNGVLVHTVTVGGCKVAFTHGHMSHGPDKFTDWISGQASTPSSPLAQAHIVVRGHYHSPRVEFSRGRWVLGAPTLDPGSRWLRDRTGEWSKPGVMSFRIHDADMTDLRFWEA